MNEVDSGDLGLCLDTGHYYYGGGNPVEAVSRYGPRVEYLHLKDVNPRALEGVRSGRLGFLEGVRRGVFCELGAGAVDFPGLKRELDIQGYNGWAVVEQDVDAANPSGPLPAVSAAASRKFLSGLGV